METLRKSFAIPKRKLYGEIDYTAVFRQCRCGKTALEREGLGRIDLPSGRIAFFDPYHAAAARPFTATLPVGVAHAFVLTTRTEEGTRVAFAGLDCGKLCAAVVWKLALYTERDVLKLLRDDTVATHIGSGVCGLCDLATLDAYLALVRAHRDDYHPLDGVVRDTRCFFRTCAWGDIRVPIFSAGKGEGAYAVYFGYDESGEACGVLCDFGLASPPTQARHTGEQTFVFDVSKEAMYEPDPKLSAWQNEAARYTFVLDGSTDEGERFVSYARRGYIFHEAELYDDALEDYKRAIEIGRAHIGDPAYDEYARTLYENAADIYRRRGDAAGEIALCEEALSAFPACGGEMYARLIRVYRAQKEYAKALATADAMAEARPDDPTAYMLRGELYADSEEYERALADMDILIEKYALPETILDKAAVLLRMGRLDEALRVSDGYLLTCHANEAYYGLRADILFARGDFSAGYVDAVCAHDMYRYDLSALRRLIEADGKLLRYKQVVKWATEYIAASPRSGYGYFVRADAYMRMQAYEDAAEDLGSAYYEDESSERYARLYAAALCAWDKRTQKKCAKILRKRKDGYFLYVYGLSTLFKGRYGRAERILAAALTRTSSELILRTLIDCYLATRQTDRAAKAIPSLAELADSQDVFLTEAKVAAYRGTPIEVLRSEYIKKFLSGCEEEGLLDGVDEYFSRLAPQSKT